MVASIRNEEHVLSKAERRQRSWCSPGSYCVWCQNGRDV